MDNNINIDGQWRLSNVKGLEAYIKSRGVPPMQRRIARGITIQMRIHQEGKDFEIFIALRIPIIGRQTHRVKFSADGSSHLTDYTLHGSNSAWIGEIKDNKLLLTTNTKMGMESIQMYTEQNRLIQVFTLHKTGIKGKLTFNRI